MAQAPRVRLSTSLGDIVVELDCVRAPKTTDNFLAYVREGYYDGTIFHRVIDNFMIQTGGFESDMKSKQPRGSIENEADNGLRNTLGTVAMARTSDPIRQRAVFHQRRRQRLSRFQVPQHRWLGLLRVRRRHRRSGCGGQNRQVTHRRTRRPPGCARRRDRHRKRG